MTIPERQWRESDPGKARCSCRTTVGGRGACWAAAGGGRRCSGSWARCSPRWLDRSRRIDRCRRGRRARPSLPYGVDPSSAGEPPQAQVHHAAAAGVRHLPGWRRRHGRPERPGGAGESDLRIAALEQLRPPGRPFILHLYASSTGADGWSAAQQVGQEIAQYGAAGSRPSSSPATARADVGLAG